MTPSASSARTASVSPTASRSGPSPDRMWITNGLPTSRAIPICARNAVS